MSGASTATCISKRDWKRDHVCPLQLYYCVETIRVVICIGGVGRKTKYCSHLSDGNSQVLIHKQTSLCPLHSVNYKKPIVQTMPDALE